MSANVYFFGHSIVPPKGDRGSPGRCAFDVKGRAIEFNGSESLETSWEGVVYADGYGRNRRGPNMDPNVLSDVIPWHLSFCKMDGVVSNAPGDDTLGEIVRDGDLIIFGGYVRGAPRAIVYIDTVLCVEQRVEIPQSKGKFTLDVGFDSYWAPLATKYEEMSWEAFQQTNTFKLNLSDAGSNGYHHDAVVNPQYQIVGRRYAGSSASIDRTSLRNVLTTGAGFNFIPLRSACVGEGSKALETRPGIFTTEIAELSEEIRKSPCGILLLSSDLSEAVLDALSMESDRWVLDPIESTQPLTEVRPKRW